jgi:mono/diheme cytochrome c family protein
MVKHLKGLRHTALLLIPAIFTVGTVEAHPAHAKPVNYPFVVGFERFHSSNDDNEYLAAGGLILLNELNCVACHAPPPALADTLTGVAATDLTGAATRLDPVSLEIFIRNPRFLKRDSTMPSLFAGPDRNLDEVNALKHYLATLTYEVPDYPVGEIETGRSLYHHIGCVACHAPELGYRPAGLPDNAEVEMTGLASVPMNLADLYDLRTLAHFLLHPNSHRPSGRMPDFRLSEKDAIDLAAYLKAGPDLVLPENLTKALDGGETFVIDPALVAQGRALFATKNCIACHQVPGAESTPQLPRSRPLFELQTEPRAGCFSDRPVGGAVPFYGLDEVQKRAIAAALARLAGTTRPEGASEIDWRMKLMNCYACHERDGIGGAETSREVYFGFATTEAQRLGRRGHLPPALDLVGATLTPDWLIRVLHHEQGGGGVRPYLATDMPLFRKEMIDPLRELFLKVDASPGEADAPGTGNIETGKAHFLGDTGGCVRCHGAGEIESTEWPGINLATSPVRLQREAFDRIARAPRWSHPGALEPPAEFSSQQLDDLWSWLKSLGKE